MAPMSGGTTSQPRTDGAIRAGTVIGRYVVIERLGVGGMGVVLSAYDPKLDRKVAVKLLRSGRRVGTEGETAQQRLLREAQAMAKLDHPNVVSVHDVGTHDGTVFVAMEFVRGQTLRAWSQRDDGPRPWAAVVDVMRQAALGLIAAHDAGLIHRDFKPDNVMIGDDARVRVMDFGLVRAEGEIGEVIPVTDGATLEPGMRTEGDIAVDAMDRIRAKLAGLGKLGSADVSVGADTLSGDDAVVAAVKPERAFEQSLTRTGALLGTPAYMAPEQIEGTTVDARTDQFAFCVTLFEALYGERPFAGDTWTALAASILQAKVISPKADPGVPPWLRAVVLRGLQRKPEERFADLTALVAALDAGRRGNAKWIVAGLAGAAVATLGVVAAGSADPCDAPEQEVRDAWSVDRADALRRKFEEAGAAYATDTAERTIGELDAYAAEWADAWQAACRATHDGAQSQRLLDLRMGCLDGRRRALEAMATVLVEREGVEEEAVDAVARLPAIERCADLEALTSSVESPPAAVASAVSDIRARLPDADALEAVGRYSEGVELATTLLGEAESLEYAPLIAEVSYRHGVLLDQARRPIAAAEALRRAASEGRASGADHVAAEAEVRLVFVTGVRQAMPTEGRWWAEHSRAAIARAGHDELLEARRLNYLGATAHVDGDVEEADRLLEQAALAHEQHLGPDHPDTLDVLRNRALSLTSTGRLDKAVALSEDVLRRVRGRYGDDHPKTAEQLGAVADAEQALGDLGAATSRLQEALGVLDRGGEGETVRKGILLVNLAAIEAREERYAKAVEIFTAGRAIFARELGEDHPTVLRTDVKLAIIAKAEGRSAEAVEALDRLAGRQRTRLGADHPDVATTLYELALAQLELGRRDDAVEALAEAEKILSSAGLTTRLEEVRTLLAEARDAG